VWATLRAWIWEVYGNKNAGLEARKATIADSSETFQTVSRDCLKRGSVAWVPATLACMRRRYLTDLSDAEWEYIEGLLPTPENKGRPRLHSLREILNAIFYVVRSGCAWRLLPHDFPPWKTVYHYFRLWRLDGTWEKMHAALRQRGCGYV
jgi:hypothetical protein